MITLYTFGPGFGLPDPSPFVMKTEIQLAMAGIPYMTERGRPPQGPKNKLPFIVDGSRIIGDSTFIRAYLESTYHFDLDRHLTKPERAFGWSIERMMEDHLYWAMVRFRWMDEDNFARGPAHFFDGLPEPMRESVRSEARKRVCETLYGQGLGRHSDEESAELGARSLQAVSELLDNRRYIFGDRPCGADATVFAMVACATTPYFKSPLNAVAAELPNLGEYCRRMMREFYPEFALEAA